MYVYLFIYSHYFLCNNSQIPNLAAEPQNQPPSAFSTILQIPCESLAIYNQDDDEDLPENSALDLNIHDDEENAESVNLDMLEAQAHSLVTEKRKGAKIISPFIFKTTRLIL
jgi:hypothetical protein